MRHLLRTTLAVVLAASYLTLEILSPQAATALGVWLAYALFAGALGVVGIRGHGRR